MQQPRQKDSVLDIIIIMVTSHIKDTQSICHIQDNHLELFLNLLFPSVPGCYFWGCLYFHVTPYLQVPGTILITVEALNLCLFLRLWQKKESFIRPSHNSVTAREFFSSRSKNSKTWFPCALLNCCLTNGTNKRQNVHFSCKLFRVTVRIAVHQ